ncbi:MAG: class I SAM-dependent methyltransferase [Nocardiopsaceae bacterium]|nr:class I SAM-dependent methyltransferase [Nocardiopsaceae bacterium]
MLRFHDARPVAPPPPAPPSRAPASVGAFRLFLAFLREQSDPDRFYGLLARDSVALVERHHPLDGARVVDVGGGAGYFADAFRARGASCLLVEPDAAELASRGTPGPASVIGDGYWLPLADGSVDVCFSCNVLEHVRDPAGLIDEMIRVTRPGGIVYVTYTVWLSPWGGHETAPFHYLGGNFAMRHYTRRHGRKPKNVYGQSMFGLGVGPMLSLARGRTDVACVEARPRYYPRWCRFLVSLPGLRELLTWNLLLILRRQP